MVNVRYIRKPLCIGLIQPWAFFNPARANVAFLFFGRKKKKEPSMLVLIRRTKARLLGFR
jgi:hypothetical protein